jgi:tRNA(fMet)-specific endonuclease VapC
MKASDGDQLSKAQKWLSSSVTFLANLQIITIDENCGKEFDKLRVAKGLKKIGRGDLLIASIALANNAILVTRNERDFRRVPGLKIENWLK